ncbi:MAG TPA: type II secretion system F family protein [Polyangia bacterium]|jgi:tight adherence protein C
MDLIAGINPTLLIAAGGGLVAVIAIAFGARALFGGRRDEVIERLERATGAGGMDLGFGGERVSAPQKRFAALAGFLRPFARLVKPSEGEELSRIQQSLVHAGFRTENAVEILLGVKLLLPLIVIILLWQIDSHLEKPLELPPAIAIAFIFIAFTFFLPNLWLRSKIAQRQALVGDALPDSMDLLVTCVEAGLSLDAAMGRVAQELELVAPVLAQELKQTLLEIQAGVRRSDAFHRLSNRTGVEDLRTLSAMIIQTELFGTSVSRALRVHAEGMRTKRMQRAEEKAAMVSVKMTIPLIMCILPSLFAVVLGPAIAMITRRMAGQ